MDKQELVTRALQLYAAEKPDGAINDGDTVLRDLLDEASSVPPDIGDFPALIEIWKDSTDQAAIEAMFELLFSTRFVDFLERVVNETTRPIELYNKEENNHD